jgi:hypothetical protein
MKKFIYRFVYATTLILLNATSLIGKTYPFIFEESIKINDIILGESPAELMDLNTEYARYVFDGKSGEILFEHFPVAFNTSAVVKLKLSYNSVSEETKWMTVDENGLHSYKPKQILTYYGTIEGDKGSQVFLTYSAGNIFAVIRHATGEVYSISPEYKTNKLIQLHFMILGDKLKSGKLPWLCLTEESIGGSTFGEDLKHLNDTPLSPSRLIDVKVACEATSEFYYLFFDLDKASAYISSVISHSSKIYEQNINVRLTISYVLIWQNSDLDPYKDLSYLNDKLGMMPKQWQNKEVERSIAVLFASLSAQPGGTYVAGIAFGGSPGRGNLCNSKWGYCVLGIRGGVKFPTTNYAWDINVATHEMGHLFGAPHTHRCYWNPPIDTCVTKDMDVGDACNAKNPIPRPGTIMSYCHLANSTHSVQLFFHQLQRPLMRKAAERASCHKDVAEPYISLLDPLGGKVYRAGDIIPVRWTAAKINTVSIKYSLDSGKHWARIADYINVNDSIYYWETPEITNNEVMILVHKSTDMTIHDMSWLEFSISQPAVNIIAPRENSEYTAKRKIEIMWSSIFVDSLQIDFSSDGGTTWNDVVQLGDEKKYEWVLPDIESDNCIFRISSLDGTDIITQSCVFKVGLPYARLISPVSGDVVCTGQNFEIYWESKFINILYLKYSLDDGFTWKKITPIPLKAGKKHYTWKVKQPPSEQAKIQIVTRIDNEEIFLYQMSGSFEISECPSDYGQGNKTGSMHIEILPQSADGYIKLVLPETTKYSDVKIRIYTNTGKFIRQLINDNAGTRIYVNTNSLANGIYVLMIENKDGTELKRFNIAR